MYQQLIEILGNIKENNANTIFPTKFMKKNS